MLKSSDISKQLTWWGCNTECTMVTSKRTHEKNISAIAITLVEQKTVLFT